MRRIAYLKDLLFPPKCAACHKLLEWRSPADEPAPSLCSSCLAEWESEELASQVTVLNELVQQFRLKE